ncbi:hypothetical protein SAY86_018698 [Trapa natans]|uniref:Serine aminopeptidase S33 domain-containing protein n=1 Tax=Trapa natans TaxID=22666 RepID=A0AAN7LND1_TRANT|nr:hypothetical protein SAY86_018698 [Trapa natans]
MKMADEVQTVKYEEIYISNSRGLKLFTCQWLPLDRDAKALIFICHGYAMECSITMKSTAIRLVNAGYAVYGMDYEGHGKSDGLQGLFHNFDDIVDDCSSHFTSVCEEKGNRGRMRYLLGESMGGAMALCLHRKKPKYWDGAILVAPMCKIADELRSNQLVLTFLSKLCNVIPSWRVVPTSHDIIELAFKMPEIRKQVKSNPYCYKGRPRLKTCYECLRVSMELEKRLDEVSLPFIVLLGEDDRVTDKSVSRQLYEKAMSTDKTLKLYARMWHGLLYGEDPANIEVVFTDIIGWLDKRTSGGNSRVQGEKKLAEEVCALRSKY